MLQCFCMDGKKMFIEKQQAASCEAGVADEVSSLQG